MMYKLTRFFYHNLTIPPTHYKTDVMMFDDLVELNDFVYNTYRHRYTIVFTGKDYLLYASDKLTEIHCVVGREDNVI